MAKSAPERLGIFGGSFDPIHNTHLRVAQAALEQAHLDQVLFVPSADPPHKRNGLAASAEDRFDMVKAALTNHPSFQVSRLELDRPGTSYTVDTLREMQAQHPDAHLFLVVGYDCLLDLPQWRDPQGILARAHLLVLPRPGRREQVAPLLAGHYDMLQFEESPVSSTEIRQRLRKGEDVSAFIPPAVCAMIRDRGLYHG